MSVSDADKKIYYLIKNELDTNLDADLPLSYFTQKHHIDEHKMTDGFLAVIGYTIGEYRLMSRMESAKKQLRETLTSIAGIAYSINYSGARSFAKAFKKFTGYSPTAYRKQYRKNVKK